MSVRGRRERSRIAPRDADAVLQRLTKRFAPWSSITLREGQALEDVSLATDPDAQVKDERPEVTAEDALDALALAGSAMFHLETSELAVMAYARHVLGIEWEPIGLRLGYAPSGAKQGAQARYARLAGRYPWVVERVKMRAKPPAGKQEGNPQ